MMLARTGPRVLMVFLGPRRCVRSHGDPSLDRRSRCVCDPEPSGDYAQARLVLVDDSALSQRRGMNSKRRIDATIAGAHPRSRYDGAYRMPLVGALRADA